MALRTVAAGPERRKQGLQTFSAARIPERIRMFETTESTRCERSPESEALRTECGRPRPPGVLAFLILLGVDPSRRRQAPRDRDRTAGRGNEKSCTEKKS